MPGAGATGRQSLCQVNFNDVGRCSPQWPTVKTRMNQPRHNLLEVDMKKELKKLVLNQETVRNLAPDELQDVVGGFNTMSACASGQLTCPECNPPANNA